MIDADATAQGLEIAPAAAVVAEPAQGNGVAPSGGCGCTECASKASSAPGFAFAIGSIDYDLVSEARLDSLRAHIGDDPRDPRKLLEYLVENPWEAASVTWTLSLDDSPMYAIIPAGPFAGNAYEMLRGFLLEHEDENSERVAIPGRIRGRVVLMTGQTVDVIEPELRGMASWTTSELTKKALKDRPTGNSAAAKKAQQEYDKKEHRLKDFLERVYHEFRNMGAAPEDRALNFAATNAFNAANVFGAAVADGYELDQVIVERSPICRPESDCWDVKLFFFDPEGPPQSVRKTYRFTVDVSDVVPVMVGPVRSWWIR